jgi:L-fuconolactonase
MEIVDTQLHLPRLATNWRAGHPRIRDRDAPASYSPAFPILEPPPHDITLAAALAAMDAAGVDAIVVDEWVGMDATGHQAPNIVDHQGVRHYTYELSGFAARRYPERFSWLGRLDPCGPDLPGLVAEMKETPGRRYLRVDPLRWVPGQIERFARGGYGPVFHAAREHELPVSVWVEPGHLASLEPYLRQYPDVPILVDHAARHAAANETIFRLSSYENLSLKWSGTESVSYRGYPYPGVVPLLLRAIHAFGSKRVLWASDWTEH